MVEVEVNGDPRQFGLECIHVYNNTISRATRNCMNISRLVAPLLEIANFSISPRKVTQLPNKHQPQIKIPPRVFRHNLHHGQGSVAPSGVS